MKSFIVVALLVASASATPAFVPAKNLLPDGRIVGGSDIDISQVPWQISLQYYGSHICGGSIISEKWVVTAAHCTDGSSEQDLNIRAGTSTLESGGQEVDIAKIHQNPKFDDYNIDWDISLLELASPIDLSGNAAAVNLPEAGQTWPEGTETLVSGWGTTSEDAVNLPNQLQGVNVDIVSSSTCNDAYGDGSITDRMLCAGVNGGGKDSCQGDSGGPLVVGDTLAGIVSWGYGCARAGYPGVYGNVAAMRDFITDTAGI
ncbi:hypothetical protein Zmor_004742 [Zophobas morio]|uniref:Peptidase S1 domain-containing protein n=1 Tax=Zophobas morio TaxID=2755281 RepID=A0AA38IMS7_9CUCU|nr:hypothetical protein Zmor_004742 [Zophobas morio]